MDARTPGWISILPDGIRRRISERVALQAIIANSGWLIFDKLVRMILTVLVGAWVARYLGPADFGELAYVLALIAMFQAVTTLGADGIAVRDIARDQHEAPSVLGTLLAMRVGSGIVCWIIAIGFAEAISGAGDRTPLFIAISGGALVFQASDTVDLWFQSQSQSRRTVVAKLAAYLCSNALKVLMIFARAPLVAFVILIALEASLCTVGLAVAYRRFRTGLRWQLSRALALALLQESWPFLLSNLSVVIYMRIDQIMIKQMLGGAQLGIYAAAISISQLWQVFPTTLAVSLAPHIARKKAEGEVPYQRALFLLFRAFGATSLLLSLITAVSSPVLVRLLYGPRYSAASPILSLHVFTNFFVFQGVAQGLWLINERAGRLALYKTVLGAGAAVGGNLLLLPRYGAFGGAISALLSFGTSAVFSNVIFAPRIFLMQLGLRTNANG